MTADMSRCPTCGIPVTSTQRESQAAPITARGDDA